jgi:hypothetical protein
VKISHFIKNRFYKSLLKPYNLKYQFRAATNLIDHNSFRINLISLSAKSPSHRRVACNTQRKGKEVGLPDWMIPERRRTEEKTGGADLDLLRPGTMSKLKPTKQEAATRGLRRGGGEWVKLDPTSPSRLSHARSLSNPDR